MPLEATVIVLDNSEYMRNGDYAPTRFVAQGEAATTLFDVKVNSNPENTVGLMTMAGKGPEVLVTHTREIGQMHSALHSSSSRIGGSASIPTAIAIAQLALKHRQNKNLRQRVVLFVGSPIEEAGGEGGAQALIKLAKKLKKNNVAVDIVAFGDAVEGEGQETMRLFVDAANSGDNSHYISIPPGPHFMSDILFSSPILAGDNAVPDDAMAGGAGADAPGAGGAGGSGAGFEFGVDPSLDPELAMALRMSMEEEQARQARTQQGASLPTEPSATSAPTAGAAAATATAAVDDDEDAMLQRALAMSSEGGGGDVEMAPAESGGGVAGGDDGMSEDEEISKAIEMSMKGEGEGK